MSYKILEFSLRSGAPAKMFKKGEFWAIVAVTYGHVWANWVDLGELGLEQRVELLFPHLSAQQVVYQRFHLDKRTDLGESPNWFFSLDSHILLEFEVLTLSKVTSESMTYSSVLFMAFLCAWMFNLSKVSCWRNHLSQKCYMLDYHGRWKVAMIVTYSGEPYRSSGISSIDCTMCSTS